MDNIIIGYHAIEERMKLGGEGLTLLIAKASKRNSQFRDMAKSTGIKVTEITMDEMDRMCSGADHRGIGLEVIEPHAPGDIDFDDWLIAQDKENSLVVVLDGITDPHNFGAILRSADKFSVDLVVVPSRRSARENQTVAAASAGAVNWVPHSTVTNLTRTLERLKEKGYWVYGADMGGQPIETSNLTGKVALIMGGEGSGISRLVKDNCDVMISISTRGHVDSLNVSVAAGILMYEIRRQQRFFH